MSDKQLKITMAEDLGFPGADYNYPPGWIAELIERLIDAGWRK